MARYEYKVVPAPMRGNKVRGMRDQRERFAHTLTQLMNELAAEGWEYRRAETLPCEERRGLFRKEIKFQNMLIFRRALEEAAAKPDLHRQDTERRIIPEAPRPVAPEPPSPVAMAGALTPNAPAGPAPRLAPVGPAVDSNVTSIAPRLDGAERRD